MRVLYRFTENKIILLLIRKIYHTKLENEQNKFIKRGVKLSVLKY